MRPTGSSQLATATLGVKLDEQTRARLKVAAERQGRTTHWLVKQAILAGLERLERGEALLQAEPLPEGPGDPVEEASAAPPFLELAQDVQPQTVLRAAVTAAYRRPEPECLPALLTQATLPVAAMQSVRAARRRPGAGAACQALPRPGGDAAAGIRAVQPGRRGADVPGRGAAAHPRHRHPRRADPRQDRRRRLAQPSGRQPLDVRARRHLGPAADRPTDPPPPARPACPPR